MKVLVVHSGNHEQVAPFITEQAEALREAGCEVCMFAVEGHGIRGYLRCLPALKKAIAEFMPDIVHAHYGLCGLLCTVQHKVPVVVTYHGSDINNRRVRLLSRLAMHRAAHNIFVSKKLLQKAQPDSQSSILNSQFSILPCGIDTRIFHPMSREEALKILDNSDQWVVGSGQHEQPNLPQHIILFAGAFDNEVKNPQLAKEACALVPDTILLELKGYNRIEVAALMNIADALLITSHSEGSPQVAKEALACGLPVVSVDVGDVEERLKGVETCYIAKKYEPKELAELLKRVLYSEKVTGNKKLLLPEELCNQQIAKKLMAIYARLY